MPTKKRAWCDHKKPERLSCVEKAKSWGKSREWLPKYLEDGVPLLSGKAERVGIVLPEEEKPPG